MEIKVPGPRLGRDGTLSIADGHLIIDAPSVFRYPVREPVENVSLVTHETDLSLAGQSDLRALPSNSDTVVLLLFDRPATISRSWWRDPLNAVALGDEVPVELGRTDLVDGLAVPVEMVSGDDSAFEASLSESGVMPAAELPRRLSPISEEGMTPDRVEKVIFAIGALGAGAFFAGWLGGVDFSDPDVMWPWWLEAVLALVTLIIVWLKFAERRWHARRRRLDAPAPVRRARADVPPSEDPSPRPSGGTYGEPQVE